MKKIKRTKLPTKILLQGNIREVRAWTGTKQRKLIQNELKEMTNNRCSYCGEIINKTITTGEIEHFYPKADFPKLKSLWQNLFWSCNRCNSAKSNKFSKVIDGKQIKPLKPDLENSCSTEKYEFGKWFRFDFDTGEILPMKSNKRAEWTIEWLDLNSQARLEKRIANLKDYKESLVNCIARKETKRAIQKEKLISENYSYAFFISEWKRLEFIKKTKFKNSKLF